MTDQILMNFSGTVQSNFDLQTKHNFKKKTGAAKWYYQLAFGENLLKDLSLLSEIYAQDIPFKIFGLHTNLYITDNGYDGLFVDISPKNSNIIFDDNTKIFKVTANTTVSEFVNHTTGTGYDFAALTGIPGMIGAGIVGNSGWTPSGKRFSDFVKEITVYDFEKNKIETIVPDDQFFSTRNSYLKESNKAKTRYFVIDVSLKSDFMGVDVVREKFEAQMARRIKGLKFAFAEGSAGSVWSNAHLIDQGIISLPKMLLEHPEINADFNGATYSKNNRHFITSESTTDKDVAKLFVHTLQKVKELYGADLHKEVLFLDKVGEIDTAEFIKQNS